MKFAYQVVIAIFKTLSSNLTRFNTKIVDNTKQRYETNSLDSFYSNYVIKQ